MILSQNQIDQFHWDGYLVVEDLLPLDQVQNLNRHIEDIAAGRTDFPETALEYEPGATGKERGLNSLRKINSCSAYDPLFLEHARTPAFLDGIEGLLGPDIKLYGDQLFIKPPGGMEKTYHQDSAYFNIEPMAIITIWAALDDVTIENGCLWAVPGSHKDGLVDHSEKWMVGERQDMRIPDSAIDLEREECILMTAGSCSFHHSLLLHRSGPNDTAHHRRGMASHYMSAHARWTGPAEDKPEYPLLRGREFPECV